MNKAHIHRSGPSRRGFLGTVASAGTALGAGLLSPRLAHAAPGAFPIILERVRPNPIPGGVAPFAPFGILIHHNPLKPTTPLANISDPSQITDFDGFVGLTHIRGSGTGVNTVTGTTMSLAFQADMGFSQGKYIGQDGGRYPGTFAFV
jgi:hypothetical protein